MRNTNSGNFRNEVTTLIKEYQDMGLMTEEITDELEEIIVDIKNVDFGPFDIDEDNEFIPYF